MGEAVSARDDDCTCPWLPPAMWTTYGGAVEPGSTREPDMECPEHGVLADAEPWLQQCGPCDGGLPMTCSHPTSDPRVVIANLVTLVRGYQASRPRVVTTAAELDAVPRGHVVYSADGSLACRFDRRYGVVFGDDRPFVWSCLELPATVVWSPPAETDGAEEFMAQVEANER